MKMLVIPDVHLKPEIFDKADYFLSQNLAENTIFIGDLVDDWGQDKNIELYTKTIDRAIKFKKDHPESLWCYGNHEVAYMTNKWCSGNSELYRHDIKIMLNNYERIVEPKIIYPVDKVVFSHAGIEKSEFSNEEVIDKLNEVYNLYNAFDYLNSPLWSRPDVYITYQDIPQVVGHSPMRKIEHTNNMWFVDTFSTCPDGSPYGDRTFLIIDTNTLETTILNYDE